MTADGPSDANSPTEDLGNVPGRGSWGHESCVPCVWSDRPRRTSPRRA